MKTCTKCGEEKLFSEYHRSNNTKSGLIAACKSCEKVRRHEKYVKNIDKVAQQNAEWHQSNRSTINQRSAEWYRENSDRHKELMSAWRRENQEAIREKDGIWKRKNPDKVRMYSLTRRARMAGIPTRQLIDISTLIESPCVYCGGPFEEVDHVVPLVRGGSHAPDNLVPSCLPCNRSKGSKLLSEWKGYHSGI